MWCYVHAYFVHKYVHKQKYVQKCIAKNVREWIHPYEKVSPWEITTLVIFLYEKFESWF